MAVQRAPTGTVSGVVEAVNPKGLKVEGTWYNRSQYRSYGGVLWPTRGQQVTLLLDGDWLVDVEIHDDGRQQAPSATESPSTAPDRRQRVITRLSVLKSAAAFAA